MCRLIFYHSRIFFDSFPGASISLFPWKPSFNGIFKQDTLTFLEIHNLNRKCHFVTLGLTNKININF